MKSYTSSSISRYGISAVAFFVLFAIALVLVCAAPAEASEVSTTNQEISVPSVTTTDPASNTGQSIVNDLSSTSEVQQYTTGSGTGDFTAFITAEGTDGNTYVSSSFNSSTVYSIIDNDTYSNIEIHLIYENGSTAAAPMLLMSTLGTKGLQFDDTRDIEVASSSDTSYSVTMSSINNAGNYYDYDTYVSNGLDPDDIYAVYLNRKIDANDTVEVTIPVKKGSDTTDSAFYSYSITDYSSSARTRYYLSVSFSDAVAALSTSSNIELIPSVFVSDTTAGQYWEPQYNLYKYMPDDVFSVLKYTNFRATKSSSLTALTSEPRTIYKTAEYTVDLTEIEDKLTKHGWTVQFNNGDPMTVYSYTTISSRATFTEDPDSSSSSSSSDNATHIQVSVIPAILVGDSQTYTQGEMPDDWDPTSLVTHFYKADYDSGGTTAVAVDDLGEYDKSNLDISYSYTAYGSSEAVEVDGVDDSKPGTYLVTFSYDYGDSGTTIYNQQYVYINPVSTETKDITRTIYVHNPDGTIDTTTQTATLSRTVAVDIQTDDVTYGDWSTGTWDSFIAPTISGYTASPATVSEQTVTADTEDTIVDITDSASTVDAATETSSSSSSSEGDSAVDAEKTVSSSTKNVSDASDSSSASDSGTDSANSADSVTTVLPVTGDATPWAVLVGVLACAAAVLIGIRLKRRG
ncbi:MAG: mucin-binding protein [Eggerthellaceae bacterium]|jgi:hypothetical protein